MSPRLALAVLPAILLAGCRGGAAPAAGGGTAAPASGSAAPAARTPAAVPADYVAARARTEREGRAALTLLLDGELAELHARLQPALAELASIELLTQVRAQLTAAGPVTRGPEAVFLTRAARGYLGDLVTASGTVTASMALDDAGKLAGLTFVPRPPLPPDPHADRPLRARLRLPFDGQWFVFWGGPSATVNYHVVAPDQRHAYDLVIWKDGGTHTGDGTRNEQYHCWGQPVLAPAAGTVVAVENGLPDNPPGKMDARAKAGNHVVLDLGDGAHALLAHLQQGSVAVRLGDRVTAGQRLGLTGNSGNTSEPHLHLHLQDGPTLFRGAGLPVWFDDACVDGQPPARVAPVHGQFVEHCR